METALKWGFSILNSENVFSVLGEKKIRPWVRLGDPIPTDDYLKRNLSLDEKRDLRFMLKTEVVLFRDPQDQVFAGFREVGLDGTPVFAITRDRLVFICAEFRHGRGVISLGFPGGIMNGEDPVSCAKIEFEEETGIFLSHIYQLNSQGIPIDARKTNRKNFCFLGVVNDLVTVKAQKLDNQEFLFIFLMHLDDWIRVVRQDVVHGEYEVDGYAVGTTFLALEKLRSLGI